MHAQRCLTDRERLFEPRRVEKKRCRDRARRDGERGLGLAFDEMAQQPGGKDRVADRAAGDGHAPDPISTHSPLLAAKPPRLGFGATVNAALIGVNGGGRGEGIVRDRAPVVHEFQRAPRRGRPDAVMARSPSAAKGTEQCQMRRLNRG